MCSKFTWYFIRFTYKLYIIPNLRLHLLLCMQNRKPIVDYQDVKKKSINHVHAVECFLKAALTAAFWLCLIVIHSYGLAGLICQIAVKLVI